MHSAASPYGKAGIERSISLLANVTGLDRSRRSCGVADNAQERAECPCIESRAGLWSISRLAASPATSMAAVFACQACALASVVS